MSLNKVFLGLGVAMLAVFGAAIPVYASMTPEDVEVEGTVQAIDFVAGTFTLLTEDGSEVIIDAPEGFDLALLLPGSFVEAKGTAGLDDVINANEIEMQDGSEFEVEVESDDVNDDHGGDDEFDDDSQDDLDDDSSHDLNGDDSSDDHGGDSGNRGSDHDEDDDHSGSGGSGSDSNDSEDD